jgi:D-alanyl-D-alanine carboxypeptidase
MAAIRGRGAATRRSTILTTMLAVLTGCGATGPTPVASPAVPTSPTATSAATSVLPANALPFRPASSAALPEARQKALQTVLDDAIAVFHASGITAAVTGADGSWAGSAGTGGDGHALVPAAMMNIGSITKTFTAAEIVYLAHRGLLDLNAPASRYLRAALLARGPTVRQLLSMTSGLPEFFTDAYASAVLADPTRHWSPEQDLTYATGQPAAPGGYQYTNTNFLFLGQLIERVTGLTYAAALRRDVLAGNQERIALQDAEAPTPPLGGPDQSTGAHPDRHYVPNRALASSGGAIGGIATDARALARWGYTLYGGLLLPAEQIREMTTPLTPGYGLGTVILHSVARGDTVGHDGRIFGYTAQLVVIPTRQLAVAVLIPGEQNPALFADQLADAVLN